MKCPYCSPDGLNLNETERGVFHSAVSYLTITIKDAASQPFQVPRQGLSSSETRTFKFRDRKGAVVRIEPSR